MNGHNWIVMSRGGSYKRPGLNLNRVFRFYGRGVAFGFTVIYPFSRKLRAWTFM